MLTIGVIMLVTSLFLMMIAHTQTGPDRVAYATVAWVGVFLGLMGIGAGLCA